MNSLQSIADKFLEPEKTGTTYFTSGPIVPEANKPDWLSSLTRPWTEFGSKIFEAGGAAIQRANEQLPQMLFDWSMDKIGGSEKRTVATGPGTATTYVQSKQSGGAPANPYYAVFYPGQQQAAIPLSTPAGSTIGMVVVVIAIGLAIMVALKA